MILLSKAPNIAKALIKATRPKTLIASISPVCIGTAMAFTQVHFQFWIFFFTLLTGLGIQIAANFANDLFDFLKGADTVERKGPVRVTASGLLSVAQMKWAVFSILCFTALSASILIYRGGIGVAILSALALVLALAYTTGPLPLAYLGIAEFFVLIGFGPLATGYTYYLQTLTFAVDPFLAGLAPGLLSCSILIINNLRDIQEDQKAQKKTLVVRFGGLFGKWEYGISVLLACLIPLFLFENHLLVLLCLVCLLPALLLFRVILSVNDPRSYIPLFGKTGQLLALYTFIFSLGYML